MNNKDINIKDEDYFYLFGKAMDLKYDDTVEAIYDLCQFCISTDNHRLWDSIYEFLRNKTQEVIDKDEKWERENVIDNAPKDDWTQQYIRQVKKNKE